MKKTTAESIPLTLTITASVEANNLAEYMTPAREWLASINRAPSTDEDFGQAELDVKGLKAMEDLLRSEKDRAISAAEDVQRVLQQFDDASEELRSARLDLEKVIAARKEEVKTEIVEAALAEYDIDPKDARRHFLSGLRDAIKGKRTLQSMRDACRAYQINTQSVIRQCRAVIESFEKAHGQDMTMDRRELELKSVDAVEAELRRRFEAKKAADERKRLEAESAKAKAELESATKPMKGMLPESTLPAPPKIGSIAVGSAARAEGPAPALSVDDEWKAITVTVKAAFGMINEHRERLVHDENKSRLMEFGQGVNALWKEINAKEVAQ